MCASSSSSSSLDGITSINTNNTNMKTLCFPIAGYMTVYYVNEENNTEAQYVQGVNKYIEMTMQDFIQRSIVNMTDSARNSNESMFIVGSLYVGSNRDSKTRTAPDEYHPWLPQQLQSGTEVQSSSPWLSMPRLISTIVAGSLAMIAFGLLVFFAARRSRRRRITDDDDYDDDKYRGEVENGNRNMIIPSLHYGESAFPTSRGDLECFPNVGVGYHEANYHQQQLQEQDWLGPTLTIETDTTLKVSNVYGKQQRTRESRAPPCTAFYRQSICECDEET
jgi:hypothetical protein